MAEKIKKIMNYNKRETLDIIADILRALSGKELIKTHITFKCKLDSRAVLKYLTILLDNNLIENSTRGFKINQNGTDFLIQYNKVLSFFEYFHTSELEKSSSNIATKNEILSDELEDDDIKINL